MSGPHLLGHEARALLRLLLAFEAGPAEAAAAALRAGASAATDAGVWRELALALAAHGLAPWAHEVLGRAGAAEWVSPPFLARLKDHRRATALRNRTLFAALDGIAAACAAAGLELVPLKGAALARRLYGDVGLRPMQDLDLLVRPAAVADAAGLLRGFGYAVPRHLDERAARREHFHCVFEDRARGVKVELHWSLGDEAALPAQALGGVWERSSAAAPGLRALDPATELVAVAAHAWKHGSLNPALVADPGLAPLVLEPLSGNRLVWLLDVHRLLRAGGAVPGACRALARAWDAAAAFEGALALAQAAFGPVDGWEPPPGGPGRDASLARLLAVRGLARGLARGSRRAARTLERLNRMDPHLQARPIRALELLDAFRAPAALRALRGRWGAAAAPLCWIGAALAGSAAVGGAAATFARGRARRRRFRRGGH
jgi:hypothetical protein